MSTENVVVRLNARTSPVMAVEKEILAPLGGRFIEIEGASDEEILDVCRDADAVMIVAAYLRRPIVRELKRLKVISRLGTGTDKIDIEEATRNGILVTNCPDFSTNEVADHTMALLLAVARKLKEHEKWMRCGKRPDSVMNMHRLSVQTLGIVGCGRIGRAVARRASAFGMNILACDPFVSRESRNIDGIDFVDFSTVLTQSDYLALLCPLTAETRGMVSAPEFEKMKPSAVLINTGRGELVDESALVDALRHGVIGFAAIDVFGEINVFAETGFPTTHPFFSLENKVMLTPHVAAHSEESLRQAGLEGATAVLDVLSGRRPQHIVNPEVLTNLRKSGT